MSAFERIAAAARTVRMASAAAAVRRVFYGAGHGALAMTTPGDTSMVTLAEVDALIAGAGARVRR